MSIGVPLGQRRLIERVIGAHQNHQIPCKAAESSKPNREAMRQLGLTGESGSHHYKVIDHITVLQTSVEQVEVSSEVTLPDGSTFIPKGGSRKVKLENVTSLQYLEASNRILGKLISEGSMSSLNDVLGYLGYSTMIAKLGQRKTWKSVLRFDDAYCEVQALEGFEWGKDLRDLSDLHLSDHAPSQVCIKPGKPKGPPFKGPRESSFQKPQGKPIRETGWEYRVYRTFNEGECTRPSCRFFHFCTVCDSTSHGKSSHPKS